MSVATSAIERLQNVPGRTGAVTSAAERATAAERMSRWQRCMEPRPSTTIWRRRGEVFPHR
jgi:hypothetical protein